MIPQMCGTKKIKIHVIDSSQKNTVYIHKVFLLKLLIVVIYGGITDIMKEYYYTDCLCYL